MYAALGTREEKREEKQRQTSNHEDKIKILTNYRSEMIWRRNSTAGILSSAHWTQWGWQEHSFAFPSDQKQRNFRINSKCVLKIKKTLKSIARRCAEDDEDSARRDRPKYYLDANCSSASSRWIFNFHWHGELSFELSGFCWITFVYRVFVAPLRRERELRGAMLKFREGNELENGIECGALKHRRTKRNVRRFFNGFRSVLLSWKTFGEVFSCEEEKSFFSFIMLTFQVDNYWTGWLALK